MPPRVPANAVLLHGEESFLVAEAARAVLARFTEGLVSDFGLEALDPASVTAERLRDSLLQAPFLDPRRVVVVRGLAVRRADGLAAAITHLPDTTCLLVTVTGRLGATSKLLKAFKALPGAEIREFATLKPAALATWAHERGREIGLPPAVTAFVARVSRGDVGVIDSELRKLAGYRAAGSELTIEVARELVVGGRQDEVFALTDQLLPRPGAQAWAVLSGLLEREQPTVIAYRLARHLSRVLEVRSRIDRGETLSRIQAEMPDHSYVVQKAFETARACEADRLEAGLRVLLDYEWEVKSGQADAQLGLEVALARL